MEAFLRKKMSENGISKLIFIVLYIIPFIYDDSFGYLQLISACGIFCIFFTKENYEIKRIKNKVFYIYNVFLASSISFILMYLFISNKIDRGFQVNGFYILPTFTLLLYIFIPCIVIYQENKRPFNMLATDSKVSLVTLIICIPIIFSDIKDIQAINLSYISDFEALNSMYQAFIIAAFFEEIFFRGLIYNFLRKICRFELAMTFSSLIFTAWHFNLIKNLFYDQVTLISIFNLGAIFLLGITTAYLYEKSRSLFPPIILHGIVNGGFRYIIILLMANLNIG